MPIYFRRFLCPLWAAAGHPSARAYAASPPSCKNKGQHADSKEARSRSPVRKYAGLPAPALVRKSAP